MRKRRIAMAAIIIGTGVFASYFGGAARTLFFISLGIPIVCVIYTLYVYVRFCIYQHADYKVIVKGEKTPYYFTLSNEDIISYADIKVTFMDDFSTVQNMKFSQSYHLIPGEKIETHTEILCRYRGEYTIGVKNVIVTDFLKLFTMTYPAPSTISMNVLPKIAEISRFALAPIDSDAKLVKFTHSSNAELIDSEMKKYCVGDSLKLINWKVSAKKNELFTRECSDTQNRSIIFVMDMAEMKIDKVSKCIFEDKIIESALAAANFLVKKNVPVYICYEQAEIGCEYINSFESFRMIYEKSGTLKFHAEHSPADLYEAIGFRGNGNFIIFAVHELTVRLCEECENIIESGGDVAVLLFGEDNENISNALDRRVIYREVRLNEEAADILGGTDELY